VAIFQPICLATWAGADFSASERVMVADRTPLNTDAPIAITSGPIRP